MLKQILDAHGGVLPDNVYVFFENTGREFWETIQFVQECGSRWGVKITILEYAGKGQFKIVGHNSLSMNGEPFDILIAERGMVPNQNDKFCSDVLKYRVAKDYLHSLGIDKWYAYVGLRADEKTRAENMLARPRTKRCQEIVMLPLYHAGVSKHDVIAFWKQQPFDLNLKNIRGKTPLGNCDGCFLKSQKNRAHLARYYPEKAKWWDNKEKQCGIGRNGKPIVFNLDGSWNDLINFAERQSDWVYKLKENQSVFCETTLGNCEGD